MFKLDSVTMGGQDQDGTTFKQKHQKTSKKPSVY